MDRNAVTARVLPDSYYRTAVRRLIRVVNVQALIILALTGIFVFQVKTALNEDRYFAETAAGQKMEVVALPIPNMGRAALEAWVVQAATQIMTFGFNDLEESFSRSRAFFTEKGWEDFYRVFVESAALKNVVAAQQIITAVPQSVPTLVHEGLIDGKYKWIYDMQLSLTVRSGSVRQSSTKTVRVVLEESPTSEHLNGVGISEWYIY